MEGEFMFGGMEPKRITTRELKRKLQKSTCNCSSYQMPTALYCIPYWL